MDQTDRLEQYFQIFNMNECNLAPSSMEMKTPGWGLSFKQSIGICTGRLIQVLGSAGGLHSRSISNRAMRWIIDAFAAITLWSADV